MRLEISRVVMKWRQRLFEEWENPRAKSAAVSASVRGGRWSIIDGVDGGHATVTYSPREEHAGDAATPADRSVSNR